MSRNGRIQAIDRAVRIMNCFTEERRELSLSDISEMLDINKSTVHGIISTLKYHDIINQDKESQKYRLGLYLMALGDRVANSLNIIEISKPYMTTLCRDIEETVHLATLDGTEVVYINKMESNQSMRITSSIGNRNPAHCTGVGKAMLAYQDIEKLQEIIPEKLEKFTPNTITEKSELINELLKTRENGFSFDNEERDIGLTCLAAPVFDKNGQAKYSISVSGPTVRMNNAKIEMAKKLLKYMANAISKQLGYINYGQ